MNNLFEKLAQRARAQKAKAAQATVAEAESVAEGLVDDPRGIDARRSAELAAERAGAARRQAGAAPEETGGPQGLEPTRYGDWEKAGRCVDF